MDPVDLAHDDAGDGPVVVLIHGHPFNRGMWAPQLAARLFGPGPGERLTRTVMDMMLATNPAGAAAAVRGRAERPDYQPVLKALAAPALVCAGDRDSYSTAEITGELAGCLPDPEVVIMEGVGHLPSLERPDAFNEHLLRFLTRALP